ncbi:MAG: hypothetical protein IPI21_09275 [Propionivibrio sp.]|nr:hypothetical protein [Propionivibrio sp.]
MKNQFKILCGAVALVVAGQVSADTTWTLASNYGTISSGVTVSAYANTGMRQCQIAATPPTLARCKPSQTATLTVRLGIINGAWYSEL